MKTQLIPSWSWVRRQGSACSSCPVAKSLLELSAISKQIRAWKTFFSPKNNFMHVVRWALGACAMFGACQQCRFATMDFATGTAWPALWTHLTYCVIHRHNAMVGISVEPLTVIEGLTPAAQVGVRDCTLILWSQAWFWCSMVWWLMFCLQTEASNVSSFMEFSQKTLESLFNYCSR